MTLDSTTSKVQYTQSGTTTAWPVPYKFLDNEDLIVITTVDDVDTTLVLDTDYTVAGAGDDAGGTVTISPAVATGTRVTIYREIDLDQPTELTTAGGWFPKVHEAVFDRLTMIDQQLQEQLDRAVKLAPTTTLNPDTVAEELFEARDDAQMAAAAAEDSASAAQGYAGTAVSAMDAAALSEAAAALSETNAAGSEAAAAISAGAAYVDATTAESARDTAVLKAEEAAASAAIAGAALNADAWSASVNYIVGDVVYTTTGKAYRCIDPNINDNPDTDDGSDWFLMSLALGEASNTAYRGDRGKTAYDHSQVAHAPSDAQKNSDITKGEIEAKLTGEITSHTHPVVDTVPAGIVAFYPKTTAPAGWLKANGAAISRTTYAALFSAIGVSFGAGDGTTTFNVPDLRGEFVRGFDDARGVDSGRVFGSAQGSANLWHGHTGTAQSAGAHTHTLPVVGNDYGSAAGGRGSFNSAGTMSTASSGAHTHALSVDGAGGGEARPRNIAMLACIKY